MKYDTCRKEFLLREGTSLEQGEMSHPYDNTRLKMRDELDVAVFYPRWARP